MDSGELNRDPAVMKI